MPEQLTWYLQDLGISAKLNTCTSINISANLNIWNSKSQTSQIPYRYGQVYRATQWQQDENRYYKKIFTQLFSFDTSNYDLEYYLDRPITKRISIWYILETYSGFLDLRRKYFEGISFYAHITYATKYFNNHTKERVVFICRWYNTILCILVGFDLFSKQ